MDFLCSRAHRGAGFLRIDIERLAAARVLFLLPWASEAATCVGFEVSQVRLGNAILFAQYFRQVD
jgi:hypothetical protein